MGLGLEYENLNLLDKLYLSEVYLYTFICISYKNKNSNNSIMYMSLK